MTMSEIFGFPSKQDKYNMELFIGLSTKLVEKGVLEEDEVLAIIERAGKRANEM